MTLRVDLAIHLCVVLSFYHSSLLDLDFLVSPTQVRELLVCFNVKSTNVNMLRGVCCGIDTVSSVISCLIQCRAREMWCLRFPGIAAVGFATTSIYCRTAQDPSSDVCRYAEEHIMEKVQNWFRLCAKFHSRLRVIGGIPSCFLFCHSKPILMFNFVTFPNVGNVPSSSQRALIQRPILGTRTRSQPCLQKLKMSNSAFDKLLLSHKNKRRQVALSWCRRVLC
mmetsp:Transcript_19501/g.31368  ORF Transcript_19501/g.31368 Transcript_19501/m.31368 type:complete len:223 (-) Transcript_19501:17-685(-)